MDASDAELTRPRAWRRDSSAFLIGLAPGLILGGILGLLLAPRRGRDSRAWIANRSRHVRHRATALLDVSVVYDIIRRRGVLGLHRDAPQLRDATRPS
jgi:hypothetical protein